MTATQSDFASGSTRCSVFIATSLDGFIADQYGRIDFLKLASLEGEDYGYANFFDSIDALVLGRRTYQTALGFDEWPYEGRRCFVLTSDGSLVPQHNEQFYLGGVTELVAYLAEAGVRRAYIDGGATIRGFLKAGAIDDLTITIIPTLLGSGVSLFGDGAQQDLILERARSFDSGVLQATYLVQKSTK